ncbi:cytochrome c oxidase subunit 3, partial [Pseudomonas sp. FW305-3-2-15-E-TSA4]|nr:cytochrome c oxidase subunit 3 [Pseudomonas sp. FW305-3-2-15-E-TSA4]
MSTHEGVHHDYHLVKPSPWPLVGSLAAMIFTAGIVVWVKGVFGLPKGTWWVSALGLFGILYT